MNEEDKNDWEEKVCDREKINMKLPENSSSYQSGTFTKEGVKSISEEGKWRSMYNEKWLVIMVIMALDES